MKLNTHTWYEIFVNKLYHCQNPFKISAEYLTRPLQDFWLQEEFVEWSRPKIH
jgi:hypothetical protein